LSQIVESNEHVEVWMNPYDGISLVSMRNRIYREPTATSDDARTNGEIRNSIGAGLFYGVMTGAAAASVAAQKNDIEKSAPHEVCVAGYESDLLMNGYRRPEVPEAWPNRGACVAVIMRTALSTEAPYSGVTVKYPFVYEVGKANLSPVLTSEPNAPYAKKIEFMQSVLDYAASLAAKPDASERNFMNSFVSFRFSGASKHYMASSYGGPRIYVEEPVLRPIDYAPESQYKDQVQLIDGFNSYMMDQFPPTTDPNGAGRLHLGLQNAKYTAADVKARSPLGFEKLNAMRRKYDPNDVTKSAYEDRLFGSQE